MTELPQALGSAWADLDDSARTCLADAPGHLLRLALEAAAASIAYWQKQLGVQQLAAPGVRAKLEEARVLEVAARELGLLVYSTAHMPQSMDGQVPWCAETARGRLGIEVKSHGKTVPTDDVEKFRRDLEAGDFAAGVFVSARAPIAKIPRGVYVAEEHMERGPVAVVYVSPLSSDGTQELTRSALAVAAALAAAPRRSPAELSVLRTQALVDATQAEIAAMSDLRKRLRDAEDSGRRVSARVGEAIAASQQRLSAAVATTGGGIVREGG
jgi:hypothetical protein